MNYVDNEDFSLGEAACCLHSLICLLGDKKKKETLDSFFDKKLDEVVKKLKDKEEKAKKLLKKKIANRKTVLILRVQKFFLKKVFPQQ